MLKIYNSLSNKIEEFKPIHENKVNMYVDQQSMMIYILVTVDLLSSLMLSNVTYNI